MVRTDKAVRDRAVTALQRYLESAHDLDDLELRKIWKALFYCMWHSDKPKVQAELARVKARRLMELPRSAKSSNEIEEDNRQIPKTDIEDPTRENPRQDKVLPSSVKSRTEIRDPKRDWPTIETAEPMRT